MIKDMTLNEVQDLSTRACHEPILWEQSASYQTKLAVHSDNRKKNKKNKKKCSGTFIFFLQICISTSQPCIFMLLSFLLSSEFENGASSDWLKGKKKWRPSSAVLSVGMLLFACNRMLRPAVGLYGTRKFIWTWTLIRRENRLLFIFLSKLLLCNATFIMFVGYVEYQICWMYLSFAAHVLRGRSFYVLRGTSRALRSFLIVFVYHLEVVATP